MTGRLHYIATDLEEPEGPPTEEDDWSRWFVVSALAVRASLEEKLRKHARLHELYPPD